MEALASSDSCSDLLVRPKLAAMEKLWEDGFLTAAFDAEIRFDSGISALHVLQQTHVVLAFRSPRKSRGVHKIECVGSARVDLRALHAPQPAPVHCALPVYRFGHLVGHVSLMLAVATQRQLSKANKDYRMSQGTKEAVEGIRRLSQQVQTETLPPVCDKDADEEMSVPARKNTQATASMTPSASVARDASKLAMIKI